MSDLPPYCKDETGKELPEAVCTVCGYQMSAASVLGKKQERPRPGDISVCISCGEIHVFTTEMTLVIPTIAEMLKWPNDVHTGVMLTQMQIRKHRPLTWKLGPDGKPVAPRGTIIIP